MYAELTFFEEISFWFTLTLAFSNQTAVILSTEKYLPRFESTSIQPDETSCGGLQGKQKIDQAVLKDMS